MTFRSDGGKRVVDTLPYGRPPPAGPATLAAVIEQARRGRNGWTYGSAGIGLLAPVNLDPASATRISDAVMAALGETEGRAQLEALAFRLIPAPQQASRGYIATDSAHWQDIVRRSSAVAN